MASAAPSSGRAWAIAGGAAAIAIGLRAALHPWMGEYLPLTTMYGAIALAVWTGGALPGMAVTAAGYAAAVLLFFEPRGRLLPGSIPQWVGLASYLCSAAIIIGVGQVLRRTRQRLEHERTALSDERAARRRQHDRTDALLRAQRRVLELVPAPVPLSEVLSAIAAAIESQTDGVLCSIVLSTPDGGRFTDGAAPSIGGRYLETLLTLPATPPYFGPCARAVHGGEEALVTDIAADDTWAAAWRTLALDHGLRACRSLPIRSEAGQVIGTFAMYRREVGDPTPEDETLVAIAARLVAVAVEHRRANRELSEREASLRQLADAMPQIVYIAGPDGRVMFLNARWREYTGLATDTLEAAVHPDDLPQLVDRWTSAQAARADYHAEFRLRRAGDGEYRWFLTRAVPVVADGVLQRWYGTSTDIHDAKMAVASALHRSEQLRRQASAALRLSSVDTVAAALRFAAEEGRSLLDCRGAAGQLRGPAAGRAAGEWVATEGGAPATADRLADEVCRTGRAVRAAAAPGTGAVLAVPMVGQGGDIVGVLQAFDPARGHFDDDAEPLLHQVAYMTATAIDRVRLVDDLRDADRRKTTFLATLAHELRNPLAPLANSLAVLDRTLPDDAATRQPRAVMARQIAHMVRLIDDLLDLSRISRGQIELRREVVLLQQVLDEAVETSRPLIEAAGHELRVSLPDAPVHVHGDRTRLVQVFANLLNNAAKYTAPGGQLALEVRDDGPAAEVAVRDNGAGIAAADLARIFEPFAGIDEAGRRLGGLGIGLSIVRALVGLHDGEVAVHSDGRGQGTRVVVRLPTGTPAPAPRPTATAELVAARRVLVVDDNEDAATSLALLLGLRGHETRAAFGGVAGLHAADEFRPDAVVLDIGMPDLDGYDTARRIRATGWGATVVLIAQTGWGQADDRQRSFAAGFDHHLVKPVDVETLERLLTKQGSSSELRTD